MINNTSTRFELHIHACSENKTEYYHTSFEYTDKLRISKFGKVSLKCTVESLRNGSALTAMGPTEVFLIPGWVTIFPPIVTLAFAIATKMTMVRQPAPIICWDIDPVFTQRAQPFGSPLHT